MGLCYKAKVDGIVTCRIINFVRLSLDGETGGRHACRSGGKQTWWSQGRELRVTSS